MTVAFDILRLENDDNVLWLAAATTLEDAKSRAQELSAHSPGQYIVFNQKTGDKLVIKSDSTNGTQTA